MNKGIKRQVEEPTEYSVRKGITLEDMKRIVDFAYKIPSNKEMPNNLYITHSDGQLYFKTHNFTTGLEGFKDIYRAGYVLGIENVYYNGALLNEEQRKEVFEKLLN